ncbi:alpha/beta hydrolase family protein [Paenibacillus tepidiphilus]|uniref:alpha/beta hydrolase family protein n=1 Tax=Paenibacillus tepidiphilus TaxID=2608683 RepID=UPI00123AB39D|nr:dienelactone hydrolase family protein [Paenibacillus tepidiphilus]
MAENTLVIERFRLPLKNGLHLEGEIKVPQGDTALPVLLISHGFRGHKDWAFWPEASGRLAAAGFYTVSFNFSRVAARTAAGLSEQEAAEAQTQSRELLDLEELLHSLQEGRLPLAERAGLQRLALLGHSRAGGSVIVFAAEHPEVKALAVWNGGSPPVRTYGPGESPSLPEQAIQADLAAGGERYNLERALGGLSAKALVIQGDNDREELLRQNQLFREQAPQHRYVAVAGADHTFNTTEPYTGSTPALDTALAETVAFLRTQLGSVGGRVRQEP